MSNTTEFQNDVITYSKKILKLFHSTATIKFIAECVIEVLHEKEGVIYKLTEKDIDHIREALEAEYKD